MEANPLFDHFILKQIMESVLFTNQDHLVKAFWLVFNAEIASAEVVPSTIAIKLVEFGSKLVCWFPAKLNDPIIESNLFIYLSHDWNILIEKLWFVS